MLLHNSKTAVACSLYLVGVFTDILDGFMARKFGVESARGAQLDAAADFVMIICLFIYFHIGGTMMLTPIILMTISFIQFIETAYKNVPVYDPVGKYTGSLGFLLVLIIILIPNNLTGEICGWIMSVFITFSLGFRLLYFGNQKKKLSFSYIQTKKSLINGGKK